MSNCGTNFAYEPPINKATTSNGAGPVSWGDIIGDINSQIDLKAKFTSIVNQLSDKSDKNHNHDATYSKLGHVHLISEISGLQTALNGKANMVHTHSINDVAELQIDLNAKVGINDERLSDARVPLAHNHDSIYSKLGHSHEDLYAPLSHLSVANLHIPLGGGLDYFLTKTETGDLIWKTVQASTGGGVSWGAITGNIQDQSDLYENYLKVVRIRTEVNNGGGGAA